MIYASEERHKNGIHVVFAYSTRYDTMEGLLRHVESVLQRAGLEVEVIDVEPEGADDTGIRFSIKLGNREI